MVLLGVVCTGMTLVLFYTLIAQAGPARAALAFYLSPGFAVIFGVLFVGDKFTLGAGLGLAMIVCGSVMAAYGKRAPSEFS
jgi:drug/metabolite transporter (DMT)-like permease